MISVVLKLLLLLSGAGQPIGEPIGGPKAAFRMHYEGTLLFTEGKYQKAEQHFKRAHQIIPENYSFALSLSLAMGKTGNPDEGLAILSEGIRRLNPVEAEYPQKRALGYFIEGMIQCYRGEYGSAIDQFDYALEWKGADHELRALFFNAKGYAIMLNQALSAHRRNNLLPHYHVHRRDMLRAVDNFRQALELHVENEDAQYNYRTIVDTLGITAIDFDVMREQQEKTRPKFREIPEYIARLLHLAEYDELIFLVDVSGSMVQEQVTCLGQTRFAVMKTMSRGITRGIREEQRLGIGTIGGNCGGSPAIWASAGSLNIDELQSKLRFLIPDGTTPLLEVLKQSPELFSDTTGREKSIFLISDGADVCASPGMDICEWAASLQEQHIKINILTFLSTTLNNTDAFSDYLCLAENTGGGIVYLDNYHCRLEPFAFDLVKSIDLRLPELHDSACNGLRSENLWMIFQDAIDHEGGEKE